MPIQVVKNSSIQVDEWSQIQNNVHVNFETTENWNCQTKSWYKCESWYLLNVFDWEENPKTELRQWQHIHKLQT